MIEITITTPKGGARTLSRWQTIVVVVAVLAFWALPWVLR